MVPPCAQSLFCFDTCCIPEMTHVPAEGSESRQQEPSEGVELTARERVKCCSAHPQPVLNTLKACDQEGEESQFTVWFILVLGIWVRKWMCWKIFGRKYLVRKYLT